MLILGSSMIVMLLFYLADFANSFPSYFINPSTRLNDFIKHYEAAFYDVKEITNQHKRIRRATRANAKNNDPLKLTVSTANKVFKLILKPDHSLFAEDVVFEGENGRTINFDPGKAYIGYLEDDERTKVRGIITEDGLFDGTISTQFEEFYIEPISRYKTTSNEDKMHTVMYKISDVTHPSTPLCASAEMHAKRKPSDLNTIAHRIKRMTSDQWSFSQHFLSAYGEDFLSNQYSSNGLPRANDSTASHHRRSSFADVTKKTPPPPPPSFERFRYVPTFHDFPSSPFASDSMSSFSASKETRPKQGTQSKNTDSIYYDLDLASVGNGVRKQLDDESKNFESVVNGTDDSETDNDNVRQFNSKHWRPKAGLIDTVYKYTNNSKNSKGYLPPSGVLYKSNPKILIGNGHEESRANLIITNDDSLEQHARKRAIIDPKKTTCMLYLQADHLFFEKYGTEETCIEVMTRHVQRVNSIYRNTDFNQDGKPDNISFMIKRIKVHSAKDPSYRFPGNYGVEKFLEIFSEEDYDAFCLAYMFTYRDFEMGTLGLAWTGDLKNAGGVCEKNGHYRGSLKSLNTGIVTVLNYGKHVPSAVSHVTLAHEIGHNFGSPHDPDGCTPGGDDGNFIMFARATSGDKKNNNKFSPCSLNAINPVLNVKARSSKGCFTEPQTSICGNGVVEQDEECDCGWEEDCKDACCYPQRRYPPLDEPPCRLTPNAVCSPSQGPCCTAECKIKSGDMCRSDNGCRDSSYCNGISPQCPPSISKPNKTVCNEEYVCYMGECTGSICLAYGLESCQCIPTASDQPTKACELCCKLPGENQPCLSSFQWNQTPYDVPDMFAKPGTPCNDYNGYCDVFRKCREVDPSGPIATLRKLLLSEENIASFKKWAYDHWYYCGLIFFSFISFMIISTKVLGKKPKIKSVTVVHSSPTETVRLPTDGSGGPAVVVHPIVVRTKLPLKKKVRENKRRSKNVQNGVSVPHNVNNNNSPIEAKKKKRSGGGGGGDAKVNSKNKTKPQKNSKADANVSAVQNKINAGTGEDPLGKVRNWLINSHNMDGLGSLKKSKSSPASFDLSDANGIKKRQIGVTTPTKPETTNVKSEPKKNVKKPKENRVKLQVVYRPPFKFSVKLGKHKNEISSHLIKDKRPEAVKQRAALLIRADRVRANVATQLADVGTAKATKTDAEKSKVQNKTRNVADSVETTKANKPKKTEYKRSVSAPQPEPLYENTAFETTVLPRNDAKLPSEEPHYANIPADNEHVTAKSGNMAAKNESGTSACRNFNPQSSAAIKRRSSGDLRNFVTKPSSSNVVKTVAAKRRNSCDTKNPFSTVMLSNSNNEVAAVFGRGLKRQSSVGTDVTGAVAARHATASEFKRKPGSVKHTSFGEAKGANASRSHPRKSSSTRKSYHDRVTGTRHLVDPKNDTTINFQETEAHNLISFASPTYTRSSQRKSSYEAKSPPDSIEQNVLMPSRIAIPSDTDANLSSATKTSGNNRNYHKSYTCANYGPKFDSDNSRKNSSLRNSDTLNCTPPADINVKKKNEPKDVDQSLTESPFQHMQYDVPSDLEVLLSETENTSRS